MIKYQLACAAGHEFESWFRAIDDFESQQAKGLLTCPLCGNAGIEKRPMAPAVVSSRERQQDAASRQQHSISRDLAQKIKAFKQSVIANSEDVGSRFAEEARRIHNGDVPERNIRGEATLQEANDLVEDGVPFGVLPRLPDEHN